jgi:hypothetical protein
LNIPGASTIDSAQNIHILVTFFRFFQLFSAFSLLFFVELPEKHPAFSKLTPGFFDFFLFRFSELFSLAQPQKS